MRERELQRCPRRGEGVESDNDTGSQDALKPVKSALMYSKTKMGPRKKKQNKTPSDWQGEKRTVRP